MPGKNRESLQHLTATWLLVYKINKLQGNIANI